jgi:hypothetical protein
MNKLTVACEKHIDKLYVIPYFRNLLKDFTNESAREELLESFDRRITAELIPDSRISLDKHLTLWRKQDAVCLYIGDKDFHYMPIAPDLLTYNILCMLTRLLDNTNYKINKKTGLNEDICAFLEDAGIFFDCLLANFKFLGDGVIDTYEHIVLKRRPPRCYIYKSGPFQPSEYISFVSVMYSGLTSLVDYCKANNCSFMIHCSHKAELVLKNINPNLTFVDSQDPRVLFPSTRTKSARNVN